MNLAGRPYEDAKMAAQQKCFQIKAKDAYLMLYGKATYKLEYVKPSKENEKFIVLSLKWQHGKGLEIKEWKEGRATGKTELLPEKKVPQKLPNPATEKTGKPSK